MRGIVALLEVLAYVAASASAVYATIRSLQEALRGQWSDVSALEQYLLLVSMVTMTIMMIMLPPETFKCVFLQPPPLRNLPARFFVSGGREGREWGDGSPPRS